MLNREESVGDKFEYSILKIAVNN